MNTLQPIAKLGNQILIVNKDDVSYIGKERALEVFCVQVDFRHTTLYPVVELEKHLKFNPWEEIADTERDAYLEKLNATFSEQDIAEKIIKPLAEHLVQ